MFGEAKLVEADNQFHIISAGEVILKIRCLYCWMGTYIPKPSTSVTNHNNGQGIIIGGGQNGVGAAGQIQEVIFLNDVEISETEISQINHYLAKNGLLLQLLIAMVMG